MQDNNVFIGNILDHNIYNILCFGQCENKKYLIEHDKNKDGTSNQTLNSEKTPLSVPLVSILLEKLRQL